MIQKNNQTIQYWVIVDKDGNLRMYTIGYSAKDCKDKFLKGGTMKWEACKKHGWTCQKVLITTELIVKKERPLIINSPSIDDSPF